MAKPKKRAERDELALPEPRWYVGSVRSARIPAATVVISDTGTLTLSRDVVERLQTRRIRIGYIDWSGHGWLVIEATDGMAVGSLRLRGKEGEAPRRVGARAALSGWPGLPPTVRTMYPMRWEGDRAVVDLSAGVERPYSTRPASGTEGEAPRGPARSRGRSRMMCSACGTEVSYKIVRGHRTVETHLDPDGDPCPPPWLKGPKQ